MTKTIVAEGRAATGLGILLSGGSLSEVERSELVAALAVRYGALRDQLVLRP